MRRVRLFHGLTLTGFFAVLLLVVAVACAFAGAVSSPAIAKGRSRLADPLLAKLDREHDPNAVVRVIVTGPAAGQVSAKHGRKDESLGLINGASATVRLKDLEALAGEAGVDFVMPDAPMAPTGTGTVSAANLATTYPGRDAAPNAWSAGFTGVGVGIAVIDSGVTASADFDSRLVQVRLDGQAGSLDDMIGHGTLVAGIAAGRSADGRFIGVAPGATVYAINVSRPDGVWSSDVITALKWVFDNAHTYNIRVVNLSLAENVTSSYKESALDLAVERLWAAGVFVVASAGNLGATPGAVDHAPANDPLVFTAGAFDTLGTSGPGDDTLAPWTSIGVTMDGFAKPELLAPGRRIASILPPGSFLDGQAPSTNRADGGYASISGTSFAAPQAAGAAAIAFQTHPGYSPDQVKWLLLAKKAANPRHTKIGSLSLSAVYNFAGTPGRANQGVLALVCAPGSVCLPDTGLSTLSSSWNSSSWNSSSWNSSSWNSSSWNSSSWNSSSWNSSSWNSSSWNSSSWNTLSSWNDYLWD
jgi:serine protease AprX